MARSKGNPQVVLVKQIIRAFCRFVNAQNALSSKSRGYFVFENEVIGSSYGGLPTDVPKGHCAVYVGSERSRFIIPTSYLNHSLFQALLDKAEEEYGFDHHMGLVIPCEEIAFEYLTSMLGKKDPALKNMDLNELINFSSPK